LFGYVIANTDNLSQEEKEHYKACYCGLCKALGSRHGIISRITLTYDMTFLVLLLSSLYGHDTNLKCQRCAVHPLKKHNYWQNKITSYASDMNVLLAYFNFIDDWKDDKKVTGFLGAKAFESAYKRISKLYACKCDIISKCLVTLSEIEKAGELNPDIPANCFGELMGEIFVFSDDEYAGDLREFGKALGKFIYIMDACLDLKADIKKERYNPLITLSSNSFREILNLLMADCMEKYKKLPIEKDKSIIENILYSGVWTRYEADNTRKGRERSK
jgi:hypothetical protein